MDSGILALRLVLGVLVAAHGSQKLFGWFGGHGLAGTGGFFESLGFRPGRAFAALAGPGSLSLDAVLGLTSIWTAALIWAVLVAGILGGAFNLALRRRPAPAAA